MSRRFNGNGSKNPFSVQADGFIDYVFVASFKTVMYAAELGFYKLFKSAGRNGIRNDGGSRMFLKRDGGDQGNDSVAVDFPAESVDRARPVDIRIKYNAQIRMKCKHCFLNGGHSRFILGIGNMVRKAAVRIQKLAALCTGSERLQHLICVKTACAVARVYNDPKSLQRTLLPCFIPDLPYNVRGIDLYKVQRFNCSGLSRLCIDFLLRKLQNRRNIALLKSAVLCEKFKAVAVERQMARRQHNGAVVPISFHHGCHKHRRRRAQTAVHHCNAQHGKALGYGAVQFSGRQAGIVSHGNGKL